MIASASKAVTAKPSLVFFHSASSGRCRRVEGFLAQVLQRRANHDTFELVRVDADDNAELVEQFKIETIPTLVVVADKRAQGRLPNPQGCLDIERFLAPWLR
ncbi:MAG: thioredoxin family protein [Actinobacteria bacterium]|nr:MAG: thioredoxin family protein [Actinomycetota bacterium]